MALFSAKEIARNVITGCVIQPAFNISALHEQLENEGSRIHLTKGKKAMKAIQVGQKTSNGDDDGDDAEDVKVKLESNKKSGQLLLHRVKVV